MTRWIIEGSVGFTDMGLYKISESVRAYAYLILSSQAYARSGIVGDTASALTAQSAFLNNFENVVIAEWTLGKILSVIKTILVAHRVKSIAALEKIFICFLVT